MSNANEYAQGAVSIEYKDAIKKRMKAVETEGDLDALLNDIHDATLTCRNATNGLKAAVEVLADRAK